MSRTKSSDFLRTLVIVLIGVALMVWAPAIVIRVLLALWIVKLVITVFGKQDEKWQSFDVSKMELYQSNGEETSEEILNGMKEINMRPATIAETLAWRRANPNELTSHMCTLIALGSSQTIEHERRVPGFHTYDNKDPDLYYDHAGNTWDGKHRFLGVRE